MTKVLTVLEDGSVQVTQNTTSLPQQELIKTVEPVAPQNLETPSSLIKIIQEEHSQPTPEQIKYSLTVEPIQDTSQEQAFDLWDFLLDETPEANANAAEVIKTIDTVKQADQEEKMLTTMGTMQAIEKVNQQADEDLVVYSKQSQEEVEPTKTTSIMQKIKNNALPIVLVSVAAAIGIYAFSFSGKEGTTVSGLPKGSNKKPSAKPKGKPHPRSKTTGKYESINF